MTSSGASCEVSGKPKSVTDISVQPLAALYGIVSPFIATVLASRPNFWQTEPPPSTLKVPSPLMMTLLTTSPNFSHKDGIYLLTTSKIIIGYRNTQRKRTSMQHR